MPVKKSVAAKKRAATAKKTTPAKRGPGRPKGSKNKPKGTAPAKKTAAKKSNVKNVAKPKSKRGGMHREVNPDTGFVVGTDQDAIAQALLEGGESRAAIVEDLQGSLDTTTRNGTEKAIVNMVSGVLNKMLANGYTVEQSFVVVPPTAASKRAATRARNNKPVAKKTTAKKTAAKRGKGRR